MLDKNINSDELYHYGILGQKWGVRRFQNKDGSYTSAGKRRKKIGMSKDAKEAEKIKKKHVSEMSNEELRKLNQRQDLENRYRQNNKSNIAKGMAIAGTVAATMGTVVGIITNGQKMIDIGKKVVEKTAKKKI